VILAITTLGSSSLDDVLYGTVLTIIGRRREGVQDPG
jgi:hypothetical protein